MSLDEALEIVIGRTGHDRYRWLCSDANPDERSREGYRRAVMKQAGVAITYPPIHVQAGNAAKAAGRFIKSGFKLATQEEQDRRLAICQECPLYDAARKRCTICGCYTATKLRMASEHCPEGKW